MKKRIYYHDTDCGGVVYYANYLKYFEEARTEFFEKRQLFLDKLAENGVLFVVARQEIDYKFPAHYGQTLDITSAVEEISNVRINFVHEVLNDGGKLLVKAKTVMVCVDRDIRPRALPADVKQALMNP